LLRHRSYVLQALCLAESAHEAATLDSRPPEKAPFGKDDGPRNQTECEQQKQYEFGHYAGLAYEVNDFPADHDCQQ
jgi:hypothetical protein